METSEFLNRDWYVQSSINYSRDIVMLEEVESILKIKILSKDCRVNALQSFFRAVSMQLKHVDIDITPRQLAETVSDKIAMYGTYMKQNDAESNKYIEGIAKHMHFTPDTPFALSNLLDINFVVIEVLLTEVNNILITIEQYSCSDNLSNKHSMCLLQMRCADNLTRFFPVIIHKQENISDGLYALLLRLYNENKKNELKVDVKKFKKTGDGTVFNITNDKNNYMMYHHGFTLVAHTDKTHMFVPENGKMATSFAWYMPGIAFKIDNNQYDKYGVLTKEYVFKYECKQASNNDFVVRLDDYVDVFIDMELKNINVGNINHKFSFSNCRGYQSFTEKIQNEIRTLDYFKLKTYLLDYIIDINNLTFKYIQDNKLDMMSFHGIFAVFFCLLIKDLLCFNLNQQCLDKTIEQFVQDNTFGLVKLLYGKNVQWNDMESIYINKLLIDSVKLVYLPNNIKIKYIENNVNVWANIVNVYTSAIISFIEIFNVIMPPIQYSGIKIKTVDIDNKEYDIWSYIINILVQSVELTEFNLSMLQYEITKSNNYRKYTNDLNKIVYSKQVSASFNIEEIAKKHCRSISFDDDDLSMTKVVKVKQQDDVADNKVESVSMSNIYQNEITSISDLIAIQSKPYRQEKFVNCNAQVKTGLIKGTEPGGIVPLFPIGEYTFNSVAELDQKFCSYITWKKASSVYIVTFGDGESFLIERLGQLGKLQMLCTYNNLSSPMNYIDNTDENKTFVYILPIELNIKKSISLSVKSNSSVFGAIDIEPLCDAIYKVAIGTRKLINWISTSSKKVSNDSVTMKLLGFFNAFSVVLGRDFCNLCDIAEHAKQKKVKTLKTLQLTDKISYETLSTRTIIQQLHETYDNLNIIWENICSVFEIITNENKSIYSSLVKLVFNTVNGQSDLGNINETKTMCMLLSVRNLDMNVLIGINELILAKRHEYAIYEINKQNFVNTLTRLKPSFVHNFSLFTSLMQSVHNINKLVNCKPLSSRMCDGAFDVYLHYLAHLKLIDKKYYNEFFIKPLTKIFNRDELMLDD